MATHMLSTILTGGALAAAATNPAAMKPAERLEQCFDQQAQRFPFSGIVLASDGKELFERSAGFVDAAGTRRPTPNIPFRLASVQKVLTAIAIGQLVDRKKVALDTPISLYLDGLPPDLGKVTIDQLLHHRSGVASLTMLNPQIVPALVAAKSARDLVPLVAEQPLAFPPGTRTEYSNGGYYLLGAIIEAVTHQSYGNYLQAEIFGPLHMRKSSAVPGPDTAIRFTQLSFDGQAVPKPRAISGGPQIPPTAAGDGASSGADLLVLGRALAGDTLLSPAVKARIFERRAEPWRIGQSGGSPGANTDFAVYPQSGWVVITLSNFDPPGGELMGEVMRRVAAGAPCEPIGAEDHPSPLRILIKPLSARP